VGNTPITLAFYCTDIDLNAVKVHVSQSVHGQAYALAGQQGAGFTAIPEPGIVNVNLDREPVAGSISRFDSQSMMIFYPEQTLYYGATVFVDVEHEGNTLSRFSFDVQPLSTQLTGVLDRF